MGPKKKGGKGKSAALGGIVDGVDTSQMSRDQLEIFCNRIREENEREREERNFFQVERDKLRNFWEITKNELEETRAKLRNKDRFMEEADEKNEEDIKFYKQKVKHLQFEHQNSLTECQAQSMVSLKLAQDGHIAAERELLQDKQDLKKQLREQETSHQAQLKALKLKHSEEISKIREEYHDKSQETETKFEKKFSKLIEQLEMKQKMEMSEIEERKDHQIATLTKHHDQAFNEMKTYYNDITLNNLALISSLKDELEVLRQQNDKMGREVAVLTTQNSKMSEPLKKAEAEVVEYKKQLQNYQHDKISLTNIKAKYYDTKKELDELRWVNEALQLRFDNLQVERDSLHKKCMKTILDVQQKTSLKSALLQKQIQDLNEVAEYREVIIGELTAATEVPPQCVNKKLEEMLFYKNAIIKDLQIELSKVCKAYNDLLQVYCAKLEEFGASMDSMQFLPIKEAPGLEGLSKDSFYIVKKTK